MENGGDSNTDLALALLRHLLTLGGGWLVSTGYLEGSDLQAFVGVAIAVIGFAWSVLHKRKIGRMIDTALALPPESTRADLAAAMATPTPSSES